MKIRFNDEIEIKRDLLLDRAWDIYQNGKQSHWANIYNGKVVIIQEANKHHGCRIAQNNQLKQFILAMDALTPSSPYSHSASF